MRGTECGERCERPQEPESCLKRSRQSDAGEPCERPQEPDLWTKQLNCGKLNCFVESFRAKRSDRTRQID